MAQVLYPQVHRPLGLDRQANTDDLIRHFRTVSESDGVEIDFSRVSSVYPNGAVPFAAAIDYYRAHGMRISGSNFNQNLERTRVLDPMKVGDFERHVTPLTNTVWRYESEADAQKLANHFVDALVDQVRCENGVVDTFNWCLYEVMDNVFQHSGVEAGFVMMQLHKHNRKCVISIGDSGVGIQLSLVRAAETLGIPRTQLTQAHSAIDFAVQQGVTSKGKLNQGNGLFGLKRAAEINGGHLRIVSGRGQWTTDPDGASDSSMERPVLDPQANHSTTVDWQLDCARPVRIQDALNAPDGIPDFLDSIETPDGYHRVAVLELEESLGSRSKGAEVRNRLTNYINAGAEFVVLDFAGVGVVSSSFADEVMGKMAVELGELEFRRRLFIDSASPTNRSLIERAIGLRLKSGL
jgi:hypothetical protein